MPPGFDALQRQHLDALESAYAEVLARHQLDGVLLYSGHPRRHFADDQEANFAAFGHFQHWTGQAGLARSWLLICPGQVSRLKVHAPRDFWHLPARLPDEAWVGRFEIILSDDDAPPVLPKGRFAVLGDVSQACLDDVSVVYQPEALQADLDELRVRKSEYEVACLREANRCAMTGHHAARQAFLAGDSELDIQLAYLGASRQREAALPYSSIVGVNTHGGVLHYQHYDTAPPETCHSLLMDAGQRYRGYCADITRTWSGPDADPAFRPLVNGVRALQKQLVAALRPGISFIDLHQQMHDGLTELLVEQGVITCSVVHAQASGLTRAFCPHGLGHLLGLQVHDVAGRRSADGLPLLPPSADPALRLTRELEAGMVVTIEPGVYIIPQLIEPYRDSGDIDASVVQRLACHGGIRIEDNVLVTRQGPDNLTSTTTETE
ncbi:Xaa-Pro dipeptidase [Halomonas sp. TRM85114]|uniref:Xaa-Pro dipeptidase n=1 Tax=Halomonas jincaotanensis TaxID=2810616 RepID=UPI001BD6B15C|nr:Xaa-Pro dipeptidase [Halomonas jincaotanensis]MBS9402584.1 Xaa-Pro dipeptidase [Halomonas jincaotanensis]